MRHGLAEHAAIVLFIEAPPWVGFGALACDDQHMAVAFMLRCFQQAAKRNMGVPLAHAMQVEVRLDGELPALELARCLPIEGFASRDTSSVRQSLRGCLTRR